MASIYIMAILPHEKEAPALLSGLMNDGFSLAAIGSPPLYTRSPTSTVVTLSLKVEKNLSSSDFNRLAESVPAKVAKDVFYLSIVLIMVGETVSPLLVLPAHLPEGRPPPRPGATAYDSIGDD